jgi:hypothetical protein
MPAHDLKIWPMYFDAIASGEKRCELRRNDRDYQVRDILNLREWDPRQQRYTGRGITVAVTHVLRIRDLPADLKSAMGLNPVTAPVNDLALLSIARI